MVRGLITGLYPNLIVYYRLICFDRLQDVLEEMPDWAHLCKIGQSKPLELRSWANTLGQAKALKQKVGTTGPVRGITEKGVEFKGGSRHDRNRHNRQNRQNRHGRLLALYFVGQAKGGQGALPEPPKPSKPPKPS